MTARERACRKQLDQLKMELNIHEDGTCERVTYRDKKIIRRDPVHFGILLST